MKTSIGLATALLCVASMVPTHAGADSWEVRRETREGARNIEMERREAAREMRRCESRQCVLREMREGQREMDRERREARREISWERAQNRYPAGRDYVRNGRNPQVRYIRADDRDAHYHSDGHFCRDGRHVVHLRDAYYRGDRRWYRDGNYWSESDYVNRYYPSQDRQRDSDDNDDLVRGIVIGAAVVGVIAAIHEANDDD